MEETDFQRKIAENEDKIIQQVQQHLFKNVFNNVEELSDSEIEQRREKVNDITIDILNEIYSSDDLARQIIKTIEQSSQIDMSQFENVPNNRIINKDVINGIKSVLKNRTNIAGTSIIGASVSSATYTGNPEYAILGVVAIGIAKLAVAGDNIFTNKETYTTENYDETPTNPVPDVVSQQRVGFHNPIINIINTEAHNKDNDR
jgi:light-regulated signal transduction histidine kinase (bacteriophytochrome)